MNRLIETKEFSQWLSALRDRAARSRIATRMERLVDGNAGQVRGVGGGVSELKIDFGPGYRVYFPRRGQRLIILLCGGDKGSQSRDIEVAKKMALEDFREDEDGADDASL